MSTTALKRLEWNAAVLKKIENRKQEKTPYLDKIRGSLVGGGIGDALGYPVEFMDHYEIMQKYGLEGIRGYELDFESGLAVVSDDTQMTLFTANGLLYGETKVCMGAVQKPMKSYIYDAYRDWLMTQGFSMKKAPKTSWLLDVVDLYARRAPGNACMSSLLSNRFGSIDEPINNSKGCGGVMRMAPVGLHFGPMNDEQEVKQMNLIAAEAAALTHGHPLGYVTAAILAHIVNRGVYGGCTYGDRIEDAVREAMDACYEIFDCVEYLKKMEDLLDKAIEYAENGRPDIDNIPRLGEGWVAEETLAIAVYCSCRYPNNFSEAVIASVNHRGDSDSTGAVTGNIVGAWLGYEAIEDKWKKNLEMRDVMLEMAEDLCYGCMMSKDDEYVDEVWKRKYIR